MVPAAFDQPAVQAAEFTGYVITSLVSGTSCPALQFMIQTYLIKTDAATKYSGGSCTSLRVGTTLKALNGPRPPSEPVLYATQITIQAATAPTPAPAPVAVTTDGTVTAVVAGTACPTLEFMFGSYLFKISTETAYSQASCADVKVGAHLYLSGTKRDGDNFVAVTGLGIKRDGTTTPPTAPTTPTAPTEPSAPTAPTTPSAPLPPAPFETTVTVSTIVAGSRCPYREFTVGGYTLATSAGTRYENGRCVDIRAGVTLAIVATKGSRDASVLVSTIRFTDDTGSESPADEEVSADVTVDSVGAGSSCPTLGFMVGPYAVTVTSATRYESGMCTDIKPGVALRLTGTKVGDEHVLASRVVFPG